MGFSLKGFKNVNERQLDALVARSDVGFEQDNSYPPEALEGPWAIGRSSTEATRYFHAIGGTIQEQIAGSLIAKTAENGASGVSGTRTSPTSGDTFNASHSVEWTNSQNGGWQLGLPDGLGTGDWTIEITWKAAGTARFAIFSVGSQFESAPNSFTVYADTDRSFAYDVRDGDNTTLINSSGGSSIIQPNTWGHLATTRKDGVIRIFQDGVLIGSSSAHPTTNFTGDGSNINQRRIAIGFDGRSAAPSYIANGNVEECRVFVGTALYETNFTPPTSALGSSVQNSELP